MSDLVALNRKLIDELYQRIECVLAPTGPEAGCGDECAEPLIASLAADFRELGTRLDYSNQMLQRLLGRLEV